MIKAWTSISNFGTKRYTFNIDLRHMVLCNRINLLIIIVCVIILIVLRIHGSITNHPPGIATLKITLMILSSLLNLFLAKNNYNQLSKLLTTILPSFSFLYFPLFFKYIEEDSFINYPYVAIASATIPLLIFSFEKERKMYVAAMIYSLASVFFVDILLLAVSPDTFYLKSIILKIYPFYKISSLLTFVFIFISIIYLKKLGIASEKNLELNNLELKSALDELNKAQNYLIQSEKMASVGILSAGVAHEINNPINFIYSGIQSLDENYQYLSKFVEETFTLIDKDLTVDTKVQLEKLKEKYYFNDSLVSIPRLIENIKTGSERTEQIVKALRYFASFEDEGLVFIDLNDTINIACDIFDSKISDRILIKRNFLSGLNPLKCYSGLIKQLITNLIANAIDAIENKGEIVISTSLEDGINVIGNYSVKEYYKISVKDDGSGIDKDNMNKIFLPFFTTKEVGKGTGMGLAICHSIIEKHMGKIMVNSELNNGSDFIVLIPCNL